MAAHNPPCQTTEEHMAVLVVDHELDHPREGWYEKVMAERRAEEAMLSATADLRWTEAELRFAFGDR